MKKLLIVSKDERLTTQFTKTLLVLLAGVALGLAFWTASAPVANAADLTPTEMIQSKLPQPKTLATATKQQVLDAVCAAVKKWRKDAPQIVRTAAGARREIAGDIVATAIRCLKEDRLDCELVERILAAYISIEPRKAAEFTEFVLDLVPECRGVIGVPRPEGEGEFGEPPPNVNPPPGQGGGGGGFQGGTCQVCHNGNTLTLACSDVQSHLNHGDNLGACPPTPTQNP